MARVDYPWLTLWRHSRSLQHQHHICVGSQGWTLGRIDIPLMYEKRPIPGGSGGAGSGGMASGGAGSGGVGSGGAGSGAGSEK